MAFDFEDDDFDANQAVETVDRDEEGEYEGTDGVIEYYTEEQFRARGVDPIRPTAAKPGSEAKVLMLESKLGDQFGWGDPVNDQTRKNRLLCEG